MGKSIKDLFKEKVASNGGQTGEEILKDLGDVYRSSYSSEYIAGGKAKFPSAEEWKDFLFADPLKDSAGNTRTREDGSPILVKGIAVIQDGEAVKLTWTALQKDVRICKKDGETIPDANGNPVRVKSSGNVVELWHSLKGDVTKFMEKMADKEIDIKIKRFYQKNRFNPEPVEVTVPTITCANL